MIILRKICFFLVIFPFFLLSCVSAEKNTDIRNEINVPENTAQEDTENYHVEVELPVKSDIPSFFHETRIPELLPPGIELIPVIQPEDPPVEIYPVRLPSVTAETELPADIPAAGKKEEKAPAQTPAADNKVVKEQLPAEVKLPEKSPLLVPVEGMIKKETPAVSDEGDGTGEESEKVFKYEDPSHIVVILDNPGWIYIGTKDSDNKIELLSRAIGDNKTVFSFKAVSGNLFILMFQLQNSDGSEKMAEVTLEKLETLPEPVNIVSKNGNIVSDEAEKADPEQLLAEAENMMVKEDFSGAAVLLEEIIAGNRTFDRMDKIYYLLGQCYERKAENRDPVKSAEYYMKIVDQFPFSIYYDEALIREKYLQKYFIDIK